MIDQEKIYDQCLSDDPEERIEALEQLEACFSSMLDREQVWIILHKLINDEDIGVKCRAASTIGCLLPEIPDKQKAWDDLIKLTNDEDLYIRIEAISALGSSLYYVPNKKKAWEDLIKLTNDEDLYIRIEAASVLNSLLSLNLYIQPELEELHRLTNDEDKFARGEAASSIGSSFCYLLDRQRAWTDLHKLVNDEDIFVRKKAATSLIFAFSHMPDKEKAWEDLIKLANDENISVRKEAVPVLESSLTYVSNKQKVWDDLIDLINNGYKDIRYRIIPVLGSAFSHVPNKQMAWDFLINLYDEDLDDRREIISVLSYSFSQMPDKQRAWIDLHKLTNDKENFVRKEVASALIYAFTHMPNKQLVWNDLYRLINDGNNDVRFRAIPILNSAFSHYPDKQVVWDTLVKLTTDENKDIRRMVASVFGYSFFHIPDKQKAWNNLHELINDEDNSVRKEAVFALSSAFPHLLDKQLALNDLRGLLKDEDDFVRTKAVSALGNVFPHVLEKQLVYNDLNALANDEEIDEDSDIISYANHSLGKISIFKASQAEKERDYREELEKAITFFEKATQRSFDEWSNPAQFCLPFYRSFYSVLFQKQNAKEQVDKYLKEAKDAIDDSKSKELLFEAVENLANALKEVRSLDFEAKKDTLSFYKTYCDRAEKIMKDAEEAAPFAAIVLRKGMPILDKNIKDFLEEIQKKAKIACKEAKGTAAEEIAYALNIEIQNRVVSDELELKQFLEDMDYSLRRKVIDIPGNEYLLNKIESMKNEKSNGNKLRILSFIIENLPIIKVVPVQALEVNLQKFDLLSGEIINIKDKLSSISFDISKIKLNSANIISDLKFMKEGLEKLSKIEGLNTISIEKLDSNQASKLKDLNDGILQRLDEVKILIDRFPKNNDTQQFYNKLNELKQSKSDILMQKSADIISIIGFAMQLYQQYKPV